MVWTASLKSSVYTDEGLVGDIEWRLTNPGHPKDSEWISKAKPDIEMRMASYEEGTGDFVLMSLVREPLRDLVPALAENVRAIQATTADLKRINPRWEEPVCVNGDLERVSTCLVRGPDPAYELNQNAISQASFSALTEDVLRCGDIETLVGHRTNLVATQIGIRASIKEELECRRSDLEKAHGRRFDFGPLVLKLAQILARKQKGSKKGKSRKRQKSKGVADFLARKAQKGAMV